MKTDNLTRTIPWCTGIAGAIALPFAFERALSTAHPGSIIWAICSAISRASLAVARFLAAILPVPLAWTQLALIGVLGFALGFLIARIFTPRRGGECLGGSPAPCPSLAPRASVAPQAPPLYKSITARTRNAQGG